MDEARHKLMDKGGSIVFSEFLWNQKLLETLKA
jgi:hypothetical protein